MAELPSGTVTFLFTDIVGSAGLWEEAPEAMRVALGRHDALLRAAIVEHHGHVVKTVGDRFHAAFSRAHHALAAALDAQRRLHAEPWGEVGPLRVRMVLYTGAAEERDGDYYGPTLNRADRLLASGHGGQTLLSEATATLVLESLPEGATLLDLGGHRLRDLSRPEHVFQLVSSDLPSGFPPLRSPDVPANNPPQQLTNFGARHVAEPDRVLATVLFTDIVGSTERLAALGDKRWQALLQDHVRLARRELARFRGREIKTTGDGLLATFDGPTRAIRCACAIQNSVRQLDIEIRAGLHTGEVQIGDRDLGGIAVHTGARVAAEAGPGEVLVTSTVKDLVAGSGIEFEDRGVRVLKGVPGEWRLFAVASV